MWEVQNQLFTEFYYGTHAKKLKRSGEYFLSVFQGSATD